MKVTFSGMLSAPRQTNDLSKWRKISKPTHQGVWVEVVEHIRNNSTGEIRKRYSETLMDDESDVPSTFIWEDGNFSCDCNRALFFGYANDEDMNDIEHPCGDGGYSVALENPVTGEFYYSEIDSLASHSGEK